MTHIYKVQHLQGTLLDLAVAKALGGEEDVPPLHLYSPSTVWADGGPLLELHGLSLSQGAVKGVTFWSASYVDEFTSRAMALGVPGAGSDDDNFPATIYLEATGPTPLIALCRCFVLMTLGTKVEL